MNVSLTPELEKIVTDLVEQGLYSSNSEVIREAIRLLHARDERRKAALEELKREIDVGVEDVLAGRSHPATLEEILADVRSVAKKSA